MGRAKIVVLDFGGQYAHLVCNTIRRLGFYAEVLPSETNPDLFESGNNACAETQVLVKEQQKVSLNSDKLQIAPEVKGVILSGGPASVYDENSPDCHPQLFQIGVPILGICYGQQLMVHRLGGEVGASHGNREYGPADFFIEGRYGPFASKGIPEKTCVWMSHGDEILRLPAGFSKLGSSGVCRLAAIGDEKRRLYGVQFHPEVAHTEYGLQMLKSFVEQCDISSETKWHAQDYLGRICENIRREVKGRLVVCMVSGGVDSAVLFSLLNHCLADPIKVVGYHIDTGLLRKEEFPQIQKELEHRVGHTIQIIDCREIFLQSLCGVFDPEEKRRIIGGLFVTEQKKIIDKMMAARSAQGRVADGDRESNQSKGRDEDDQDWLWAQGTIYPDTVESGMPNSKRGQHTHKIKTHHNQVDEILALEKENRLLEPLRELYKDEVRELGKKLGLSATILNRHPFPGVGLAVRYICSKISEKTEYHSFVWELENGSKSQIQLGAQKNQRKNRRKTKIKNNVVFLDKDQSFEIGWDQQWIDSFAEIPIHTVGVQGDQRTYRRPLALKLVTNIVDQYPNETTRGLARLGSQILNQCSDYNRILLECTQLRDSELSQERSALQDSLEKGENQRWRLESYASEIRSEGLDVLRDADDCVVQILEKGGVFSNIWQLGVIALPLRWSRYSHSNLMGASQKKQSYATPALNRAFVIRAVSSLNAMTAEPFPMPLELLYSISDQLKAQCAAEMIFYDLSFKPPATIEWE